MNTTKTKYMLPALAAAVALFAYPSMPSAQAQGTLTLTQAEDALSQAKAQAKEDLKSVPDCRHLSGAERSKCNHDSVAQISAINKRTADAEKAVLRIKGEANVKEQAEQRADYQKAHPARIQPAAKPALSPQEQTAKDQADRGQVAMNRKEYADAIPKLTAGCDGGNASGCTNLGNMYYRGLGVPQDEARAFALFDKGCEGKISAGCLGAGLLFHNVNKSTPNKEKEISYFRRACEGFPDSDGRAAGCEKWEELQPGAETSRLDSLLSKDPNAPLTLVEQALLDNDPKGLGQLCANRNMRACSDLTLLGTYSLSDSISYGYRASSGRDSPLTEQNLPTIQSAMRAICKSPRGVEDPQKYCRIADEIEFAFAHNFGPKANDPAKCISDSPIYDNSQKVYTDGFGNKTYGSVEHHVSQARLENHCAYIVDFSTDLDNVQTLRPHESVLVGTDMSGVSFFFIKRH